MKRWALGLVAFAICTSQALASGYSYLNAGIAARNRGDPEGTIGLLTAALQSPDLPPRFQPVARFDRASAYLVKGQFTEAIADLNAAIGQRPTWFDAHVLRGAALDGLSDFDKAISDFTEAINARPEVADGYLARATVFAHAGRLDAALADDNQAVAINPHSASIYSSRAAIFEQERRYDLALPDLETALGLQPNDGSLMLSVGIAQWATGHQDDAVDSFKDAMKAQPGRAYNWIWLAIAEAAEGKGADDIGREEGSATQKSWPAPIVDFFRGKIAEKDVFSLAASGNEQSKKAQECEADFYVGEWELLHKTGEDVKSILDDALHVCPRDFIELRAASFELTRLGGPVKS